MSNDNCKIIPIPIVATPTGTSMPTSFPQLQQPWNGFVPPANPNSAVWTIPIVKPRAPIIRETLPRVKSRAKKETFIALILDKSGSMHSCYEAALDAINEQIRTIKRNAKKGGATYVSLILFSSDVRVVFENVPAAKLELLTKKDYVLDGMTALRDAVLTGIEVMSEYLDAKKNQGFLSVLISDGQENDSGTMAVTLKARIAELQKSEKWTFSYLLSGHSWADVQDVATWSNTNVGNIGIYTPTSAGYTVASRGMSSGLSTYMTARNVGETKTDSFFQGETDLTIKAET